jgi:hypothetical protein
MFRIRDTLILTFDQPDANPAPDPALFVSDHHDASEKYFFCLQDFMLILFEGTFTSFFKIKSHKGVTKQKSRFFFIFLLVEC